MSIRLRYIGDILIAVCGAETDERPGDVYLDDEAHHALAAKFARDWQGQLVNWKYADQDVLAATQKLRDAEDEIALEKACGPKTTTRSAALATDGPDFRRAAGEPESGT